MPSRRCSSSPARSRSSNFAEASSSIEPGPYDVTLVEGSVSTPEQEEQIRRIRAESRLLITIGACATSGGVQALRNATGKHDEFVRAVYPTPEYVSLAGGLPPDRRPGRRRSRAHRVPGRPGRVAGRARVAAPRRGSTPVHLAGLRRVQAARLRLRRRGRGEPCLGPVTRTGCGALCPGIGRGCYGCFGPAQSSNNTEVLGRRFIELGLTPKQTSERFRFITGWAPAFREAADAFERGGSRDDPPIGRGSRDRTRRGGGRAPRRRGRRPDHRPAPGDLRAAPLLRGVPGRAGTSTRSPTSCRGSAGSARSRTR